MTTAEAVLPGVDDLQDVSGASGDGALRGTIFVEDLAVGMTRHLLKQITDDDIARALIVLLERAKLVVEPAGAVPDRHTHLVLALADGRLVTTVYDLLLAEDDLVDRLAGLPHRAEAGFRRGDDAVIEGGGRLGALNHASRS